MSGSPSLVLHMLPPSHPCMTVEAALRHKGLEYERVALRAGPHIEEMKKIYGEGNVTVPGMTFDGEPVHGSTAIVARLEQIAPNPTLYPEPIAEAVREAELWGDVELQDLGRHMPWGSLYFRPEAMGTFAGGEALDPAGVDFAMRFIHGTWKHHGITAEIVAADLAAFPAKVTHIEELAAAGVVGGDAPNAADFQIGATIRVLLTIGDLDTYLAGTAAETIARRWFPDYNGRVPAGAFPANWLPAAIAT